MGGCIIKHQNFGAGGVEPYSLLKGAALVFVFAPFLDNHYI
jgi:hypothetical protein